MLIIPGLGRLYLKVCLCSTAGLSQNNEKFPKLKQTVHVETPLSLLTQALRGVSYFRIIPRSFHPFAPHRILRNCKWTLESPSGQGRHSHAVLRLPPHPGLFPVPGSPVTTQRGVGKRATSCRYPGMDQELCHVYTHHSMTPHAHTVPHHRV